MNDDPSFQVPSPGAIAAQLFSNSSAIPPVLPRNWSATALLTPFGGLSASAPLHASDEMVAARVYFESVQSGTMLRTRLYLLESELFYDFVFVTQGGTTSWYWLMSDPADPDPNASVTAALGPFTTLAKVPAATFLGDQGFAYTGTWNIVNQSCDGYAGGGSSKNMQAATWFSFFSGTGSLSRIMNVDNTNDFQIPILGAYYLVNFPTFEVNVQHALPSSTATALMQKHGLDQAGPSPMMTLQDIQTAMANPPVGASLVSCSAQNINAVIPGLSRPQIQPIPPAWTNQMQSFCYMIGQDNYPYYSQVYYDYTVNQSQISVFVTTDPTMDSEPYNSRQDMILPLGATGPAVNYAFSGPGAQWAPTCYAPGGGVVPMSVPNFVQEAGGQCRALIANNPYFGSNDTISIWSVSLDGQSGWSDFWYWFNAEQQGVVFSLAPASSLTMIDYQTFVQNPSFAPGTFAEPEGGLQPCPSSTGDQLRKVMFMP